MMIMRKYRIGNYRPGGGGDVWPVDCCPGMMHLRNLRFEVTNMTREQEFSPLGLGPNKKACDVEETKINLYEWKKKD
jgi:hypothetical protein